MVTVSRIFGARSSREALQLLPKMEGISSTITIARKELMQLIGATPEKPAKVARAIIGKAKHPKLTLSASAGRGRARAAVELTDGKTVLARLRALISHKQQRVNATLEKGENRVQVIFDASRTQGATEDLSVSMQRRNGVISFDYRAGKAARLKGKVNEQEAREMAELLDGAPGIAKIDDGFAHLSEGLERLAASFRNLLGIAPKAESAATAAEATKVSTALKNIDKIKKAKASRSSVLSKFVEKMKGAPAAESGTAEKAYSESNFFARHLTTDPEKIKAAGYEINEYGEIVKKS